MHKSRNNGNTIKIVLLYNVYNVSIFCKKLQLEKDSKLSQIRMMVLVPDTFQFTIFESAYHLLIVHSACVFRAYAVCSPYVHRLQFCAIRYAPFALTVHRAFIVFSLCHQQLFIVRSPSRFNSSPLPFRTPTWNNYLTIYACLLNNDTKFI